MKALTVRPFEGMAIMFGDKTAECRSKNISYRGDVVICTSALKLKGTIPSHALCIVKIVDCVPFTKDHLDAAMMQAVPDNHYAWILDNVRIIAPIKIKGFLSLIDWGKVQKASDEIIYLKEPQTDEEDEEQFEKYYKDIFI